MVCDAYIMGYELGGSLGIESDVGVEKSRPVAAEENVMPHSDSDEKCFF